MPAEIPRIIHRIWLGSGMPPEFEEFGESWRRNHPGWEMRLWTERDLWTLRNQAIYDRAPQLTSSSLVPRMRSDIWRLEILERFGGLYIDTDFQSCSSIEPLISGLSCFAAEERPGLIANGLIGATPAHPFISRLIAALPRSVERRPGLPPWRTTGPEFLTRCAQEMPGEISLLPSALIYPYHHTELLPDGSPPPIAAEVVCHHVWASVRRSVSVVIPFRAGCPWREASRAWTAEFWRRFYPSWQIVEADDPSGDPMWSKAAAIRSVMRSTFGDVVVVADADLIVSSLSSSIAVVSQGAAAWAVPHHTVYRLSERATRAVLRGSDPRSMRHDTAERHYGLAGGGMLVARREALEACPPDPRFRGWGGEDEALGLALRSLHGPEHRGSSDLLHLWHPPAPRPSRQEGNAENMALVMRYRQASKLRPQMAALVAEHAGGI